MIDKINLPSGAVLDITLLPFEEAWKVCQIITRVVEKINVDLSQVDLRQLGVADVMNFKGPLCALLASQDVIDSAKICFKRCTHNGLKIDGQTFDKAEFRADFLPAVYHAIRENIAPFFANLLSYLGKK